MNLEEIYQKIISEFDKDLETDKELNILKVLQFGLKKIKMNKPLPEVYRLNEDKDNYIEATWTFRDGSRTFQMKPDINHIDVYLFKEGNLKSSKQYSFHDEF